MSDEAPNEILAAVEQAKRQTRSAAKARTSRKRWPLAKIGLAAGIGSAAVAAAVLFANRGDERD